MGKYKKYKDSGIAWIGEIPEHWVVKRLKFLTKFRNGFAHENDINDNGKFIVVNSKFVSTDGEVKKYCDTLIQPLFREDICIVMSDVPNGRAYAKCFVVNENFKYSLNQRVGAFYNYTLNRGYFYYFINRNKELMFYDDGFNQTNLRKPDLMSISVAYPNISEQGQIAKYLDWKCGEVDRIVDVRERQIKLLGELRTSVISRAVTRGLAPNAPLKDSGIEWIGQIPKHWEVRKISRIFSRIGSGTTPKSGNEDYYAENGENWLQTGDLNDSYIYETSKKITKKALDEHSLRFYSEGSIVMAMYGATIGKLGLLNISTTTNQACCVMSGNKICHSKYGFNTLLAARTHILTLAYGGGQPNISQDTIKTIKLPVPLIEEQQQIADYLDKKTAEIDSTIEKFKTQIDKIKEYRQALITEVVTGKIDVRGIEIPASKSN